MAYTQAWDESTPLGSTAANQIDNLFRDHKRDVRERMDTLLGAGVWDNADPNAPLAVNKMYAAAGFNTGDESVVGGGTVYPAATSDLVIGYKDIYLPIGATVTQISVYGDRSNASSTVDASLRHVNVATGAETTLVTHTETTTSGRFTASANLSHTVIVGLAYFLRFTLNAASTNTTAGMSAILVSYTLANHLSTWR